MMSQSLDVGVVDITPTSKRREKSYEFSSVIFPLLFFFEWFRLFLWNWLSIVQA